MKVEATARTDQWNAEDFLGGPRTFTIAAVKEGKAEQKYDIELVEGEGRVWRPPLTVLRLLIAAWSNDATQWVGKQVTLYLDPTIRFGRDVVGGIRVSHVNNIDKPLTVNLTVTRGKRAPFTVQPLVSAGTDKNVESALADIAGAESLPALKAAWDLASKRGVQSHPDVVAAKDARKGELS